ncbi:glycosyltransferase [Streptomyces sp. MUM 203J]|nr:glycosyltransferase [Streptomyces sp. MUM 203J]
MSRLAGPAGALADRGHTVTVFTRRDGREVPELPGVVVHHVPAGPPEPLPEEQLLVHAPEFGRHLMDALRERLPDVVHSHHGASGVASLTATRASRVPLLHTYQGPGSAERRRKVPPGPALGVASAPDRRSASAATGSSRPAGTRRGRCGGCAFPESGSVSFRTASTPSGSVRPGRSRHAVPPAACWSSRDGSPPAKGPRWPSRR